MAVNKHFTHSIHHVLLGVTLTLKGIDKVAHHPLIGGVILFFAAVVLLYCVFLIFRHRQHPVADIVILLFEVLVSGFSAYIFFGDGKKYLPFVFILAAIGFLVAALVAINKLRKAR